MGTKGHRRNKILVGGDQTAAKGFIGSANSQMELLKKQMSFQNRSQGVRRVWLYDDVYVECVKCFNYQECKIWVKPQPVQKEERPIEKNPVYFYVRVTDDFLSLYNLGPPVDRIIIWRIREMDADGVTTSNGAGLVLYDVDLEDGESNSGVVYTNIDAEGGGSGSEEENEAVIALIKEYKKQITENSYNPGDNSNTWFAAGATLGNPSKAWQYSSFCNDNMENGETKEGVLKLNECFTDSAGNKYWHIIDTPPFYDGDVSSFSPVQEWQMDNVCNQDFIPGTSSSTNDFCLNEVNCGLEDVYNSTEWNHLDSVVEEYAEFSYFSNKNDGLHCEATCIPQEDPVAYYYLDAECWTGGAANFDENKKMVQSGVAVGSHKGSEFKFPCFFFVLLEPSRAFNFSSYSNLYYVWELMYGPCPPSDEVLYSYMYDLHNTAYFESSMPSEIMTPLETVSLEEILYQSGVKEDGTLKEFDYTTEPNTVNTSDCSLSEIPLIGRIASRFSSLHVFSSMENVWRYPEEFAPSELFDLCRVTAPVPGYPDPDEFTCASVEITPTLDDAPVQIFDMSVPNFQLIKEDKKYLSLFFIYDKALGMETSVYGLDNNYQWEGHGYSFFLLIYIIEPDFFRQWNEETKTYDHWNIHAAKEEDSDETSRYRAIGDESVPPHSDTTTVEDYRIDLEEYITQVIMDIRDTNAYREQIYALNQVYIASLKSNIDTGFVFQLPLK